jgi:hypothetical protein
MAEPDELECLESHAFAKAVVSINKRAERQSDFAKLVEIFVQTDLPLRCETTDHQLILGRRGTGKTHLLRFFQFRGQEKGDALGSPLPKDVQSGSLTTLIARL